MPFNCQPMRQGVVDGRDGISSPPARSGRQLPMSSLKTGTGNIGITHGLRIPSAGEILPCTVGPTVGSMYCNSEASDTPKMAPVAKTEQHDRMRPQRHCRRTFLNTKFYRSDQTLPKINVAKICLVDRL